MKCMLLGNTECRSSMYLTALAMLSEILKRHCAERQFCNWIREISFCVIIYAKKNNSAYKTDRWLGSCYFTTTHYRVELEARPNV